MGRRVTATTIGVGYSLWERSAVELPRGGVVVDVGEAPHPETGELVTTYLLVRSWRGRLRWVTLRADQVSELVDPPNRSQVRSVCRTAAGVIAERPRDRPDDAGDLELFSLGCRLMAAIAPSRPS